jgi:molybdopterin adenylyltransferase
MRLSDGLEKGRELVNSRPRVAWRSCSAAAMQKSSRDGGSGHSLMIAAPPVAPSLAMAEDFPSKTQRKREMHELQALGAELVRLSDQQLASIDLPERLLDAVLAARAISASKHEARRRQLQYIGKLMRTVDAAPIREKLAEWNAVSRSHTARLHRLERWRARLLEDEGALTELVREHPGADTQRLRLLMREAARERAAGMPPRSFRLLFKALDETIFGEAGGGEVREAPPPASRLRYTRPMATHDELLIGLVSVSDRASQGVYRDEGIPALEDWFRAALTAPAWRTMTRLIPDEQPEIEATLKALIDEERCHLVLTTGGTGPAPRDVTPEATLAVADKVMPGFGEQMRQVSLKFVPTAILSRQVAVIRGQALIINLPGQPKAIRETLEGLKDESGKSIVSGIFAAVPYCIDLIGGPYIETNEAVVKAFRPKSAIRPKT